jgi:hypothetical protein
MYVRRRRIHVELFYTALVVFAATLPGPQSLSEDLFHVSRIHNKLIKI